MHSQIHRSLLPDSGHKVTKHIPFRELRFLGHDGYSQTVAQNIPVQPSVAFAGNLATEVRKVTNIHPHHPCSEVECRKETQGLLN